MNAKDALAKMPEAIRDLENKLWDHKVETEDLRLRLKHGEADVEAQVATEQTPDGKKAFPNDAIRVVEVRRRLLESPEFRRLQDQVRDRLIHQQRMESTLAYYNNTQRNARSWALAVSSVNALLDLNFAGEP